MGLDTALFEKVSIGDCQPSRHNFDGYDLLRMDNDLVVTLVVDGDYESGCIGEAVVPILALACCNALFAANCKRIRHLPVVQ